VAILINDLITSIEVELEAEERQAAKAVNEAKLILKQAGDEGRSNLSPEEDVRVNELFVARDQSKKRIKGIQAKLEQARKAAAEEAEEREAQAEETATPAAFRRPAYDQAARVGREQRTYNPDTDRKGIQFLRDVTNSFLFNNAEAQYRLAQHMQEERVERGKYLERATGDVTTTNWAGLTVPQYLTDLYAPAVANLRPFADICNKHELPASGMTINISQITTASSAALQSTQISAVSTANMDDTLLTENVQTAAGSINLSRQAIDRGTGIEEVTFQDLFKRYATVLDATLLTQATSGMSALCNAAQTAYTTTQPTAAGAYPKVLAAASTVETALLAQAMPSHVIMHPRRWYWFASQLTSTWPLIQTTGLPEQTGGQVNAGVGYNRGVRGVFPMGLPVVTDGNVLTNLGVGTNQDELYVVAADECHLWESADSPVYLRAEQPNAASLGVLLVLYGYFAYTLRRFASAIGSVGGTGFVTPTF
jgi:hypothetical protein